MRKIILLTTLMVFLAVGSSWATPINGTSLQTVFDNITVSPSVGNSSVDVNTDMLGYDSYWEITGSGASVSTMIIEMAGYAGSNTFGVYSDGKYVQLFNGSASSGAQTMLSIKEDGSIFVNNSDTIIDFAGNNFGFYLDSRAGSGGGLWHSDTYLNYDGWDHMVAYQGNNIDRVKLPGVMAGLWTDNEFILAFEDLNVQVGDGDYDDFVVMVESVQPVPEPATMLLLGTGLVGLAGFGRRKFFKKG